MTTPALWKPITVGTMTLSHRLVVPTHGGGNGNLMGTEEQFEQHCALWLAKIHGGVEWVGGGPVFVANAPMPDGFEPTGVGAHGPGFFRDPRFSARMGEFADRVHGAGGYLSAQLVLQGGMPIGPSATYSGHASHAIAHELTPAEIQWMIDEYAMSAAQAVAAGVDAIELHANHDDLLEWFLSPRTNLRTDQYGGDPDRRRRFLREIVSGIRASADRPFTFGLRLCLDQFLDGGLTVDDCCDLVQSFSTEGEIDYVSLDIGNNWNAPSYIPIAWHEDHEWSALAGQVKQATQLPVIYCGRVTEPAHANSVIEAGHADIVAIARATMADPQFAIKASEGRDAHIRPCIGLNECIHRKLVDGLPYACGVSPEFGRESEPRPEATKNPRSILVIGGGPAGMEVAGLCAEQGHRVELWEQSTALGGALTTASKLRGNHRYARWIEWQDGRLGRAGVAVRTGTLADVPSVLAAEADTVIVASGAVPRWPAISGTGQANVVLAVDVVNGKAHPGRRIGLVVEDDGPAPPTIAHHLAHLGHEVTVIFQTASLAPDVGKYSLGSMLGQLDDANVSLQPLTTVLNIDGSYLDAAHSYSGRSFRVGPFDTVALACGSVPKSALVTDLSELHPDVRVIGDAYAPRRTVFATRQAWATMIALN